MPRNQNHEDDDASSSSSSRKRITTFDNGDVAPWSDLNDHVLFLVMMQLGIVNFLAFSKVCKPWRSFALSNWNAFMASKPPISICKIMTANEDNWCLLEDLEGTKFKTILPHFTGRICVGSTCGYLILFGTNPRHFWLVNPITRHEVHLPYYPSYVGETKRMRGILVFSPSISGWVFVLLYNRKILFNIVGKRGWNHVSSTVHIIDLHFFKGKIYTLHTDCSLGELRFNLKQKRKCTLLETKNSANPDLFQPLFRPFFVSSAENLYLMNWDSVQEKVLELDLGEMKWVSSETTIGEYAFFISGFNYSAAIKLESLLGPQTQYKSLDTDITRLGMFNRKGMWYFPHHCLNVNFLNE